MTVKGILGPMRMLRLGHRGGRRRAALGLIGGVAASLLILSVLPDPGQSTRSTTVFHRRIQQEEEDYTGLKTSGSVAAETNAEIKVQESARIPIEDKDLDPRVKDAISDLEKEMLDIPHTRKKEKAMMSKARETALTALQHGFKLTENQRKLIEQLSPQERTALENKVSKVRIMQEKAYLQQLRAKGQVRTRKSGGEEVISNPKLPVRFPATLKKVHPRDWLQQYKIFLNLTHYPWAKSATCSNYSITFAAPDTLPTKALASFPSSGNTWIRYLVECATGLFTGSLYDDTSLTKKGMYGEGIVYNSGMTVLQKSHGYTTGEAMKLPHAERLRLNHMDELGKRGVIVIRNPFKALISHRHLDTGGHTGYAPKAHFIGKGWVEFVTLKIMLWRDFYVDWLTYSEPKDVHFTHYEKVKEDPVGEMRKVLEYLGMPIDRARLTCVGMNTDGLFKRKPSKNVPLDFDPFRKELKDLIYDAIEDVSEVLLLKGKDPLPLSLYQFYDREEAKIASNRRKQFHIDAVS